MNVQKAILVAVVLAASPAAASCWDNSGLISCTDGRVGEVLPTGEIYMYGQPTVEPDSPAPAPRLSEDELNFTPPPLTPMPN